MNNRILAAVTIVAVQALASAAFAQPVSYSFSTGTVLSFGGSTPVTGPLNAEATAIAGMLSGTSVSGSFMYDSSALAISPPNADGSISYRGSTPESVTGFATVLSGLSATVGGFSFTDISGLATVGNGTQPGGSDIFQLSFDPFGTGSTHNITPFAIGGYTLWNMRMFWIEGQMVPELVPDLFDDQSLPSAPPSIHGRLALDFKTTGEASGTTQFHVFYDGLSVAPTTPIPEPETYALLLAGLGLLGFEAWRRKPRLAAAA